MQPLGLTTSNYDDWKCFVSNLFGQGAVTFFGPCPVSNPEGFTAFAMMPGSPHFLVFETPSGQPASFENDFQESPRTGYLREMVNLKWPVLTPPRTLVTTNYEDWVIISSNMFGRSAIRFHGTCPPPHPYGFKAMAMQAHSPHLLVFETTSTQPESYESDWRKSACLQEMAKLRWI